jgi:gliding motility-associated-like protein
LLKTICLARLTILLVLFTSGALSAQVNTFFICSPGQKIQLNVLPGQFAYDWFPALGLNNPTINNPAARPGVTMLYVARIVGEATEDNLIVNPDFSEGNTGVSSDYDFVSTIRTQGVYGVSTSAANLNGAFFDDCPDHSSGTGLMMVVDGSPVANEKVWCQTVMVDPGANYAFSTWLTSVNPVNPARLQFSVNGTRLGGINDVFKVFTAAGFTGRLLSFTVYDRWGGLVFESNGTDPSTTGWNGDVKGEAADNGTYLFQLKLEQDEGGVTERNGTVVLVR